MTKKLEYKYLVPNVLLDNIRADIRPYMEIDKFTQKREVSEYTVRSIYYDTPRFDCYYDKIEGLKIRKKYRIRGYNSLETDSIVFLEIKRKYINYIKKNRAPLLHQNLNALFNTSNIEKYIISVSSNGKEKSDAQRFFYHYFRHQLYPTVLVIYNREAFWCKFDQSLRLTFDKNLRSTPFPALEMLYQEEQVKYALPDFFIFEIKFRNGFPDWIQSIIKRYQLSRKALSKYTICLNSHKTLKKFSQKVFLGYSD